MKQILVVDDAATMRLYYRSILEPAGFAVTEAWNGIEALERALLQPHDGLIVDVSMPGMDGFSFLRELRRQPIVQAPAIVVSTEPSDSGMAEAYRSGANAFLAKPITPTRLLACIRLMLGEAPR